MLVRATVDIYHHTPHDGLNGATPHNEWLRLTAKYGILPPLHPDQRRHIFGTKIVKAIGDKGVRFLGIHYVSVWEWVCATKEQRAIHRANAKLHLSVLLKAVNDLRASGSAASARAELGTDIPTAKQYAVAEKNYFDLDVEDDLEGEQPDLSELRVSHDPTVVGINEFRHLGPSRRAVEAAAKAEKVITPEQSGFAGYGGGTDEADDSLDFDY